MASIHFRLFRRRGTCSSVQRPPLSQRHTEALANGRLADRDVVAIAAALSQPWADIVLSGAATPEQLESNLRAIAFMREPADWPDITESPAEYWARRSTLAWQ